MNNPVAAMHVTGNTTLFHATNAGNVYNEGWVANEALLHGDGSIDTTVADGKLVLKPGIYQITAELYIEAPATSDGDPSADTFGEITAQLYRAGAAVAGTKAVCQTDDVSEVKNLVINYPVEITEAQYEADTNYVQVYLFGGDVPGNDILVSEARLVAVRLS
jgi:hypothetical protein